ncbi:hypothetical protein RM545_06520 [Zunongwangia sp. F260]|uniref:Uncharacterized protein n=1 Tax=Autumnicola lenta TaxID=3075593 RepID=A0ABU3CJ05_9FLAO|nr:hypothetical protein [Zunongwangia sp. F260]MDT0646339.1 hypothetical protein [Zunongwangia sp. F260]
MNRRIVFKPETITIATNTKEGKEVEVLYIQEVDVVNENMVFLCQNSSKLKITIAIPQGQEPIEVIDYYYRSLKTNEKVQKRFLVDQIE